MGYTTKFTGAIQLSRALDMYEAKYLLEANEDPSTIVGNRPTGYMQWVPTETLDQIVWDGEEKFYDYIQWMRWLCALLGTWGIVANGIVFWSGEDADDTGTIEVLANEVNDTPGEKIRQTQGKPLTMQKLEKMALDQVTRKV